MSKEIEEMAKVIEEASCGYGVDGCHRCEFDGTEDFSCAEMRIAKALYNAGYREQVEGEWKDQYNGKYANPIYVCSICGKGTLLTPYINELNNMEMTQALSPYCPNCGAKMKGEKG